MGGMGGMEGRGRKERLGHVERREPKVHQQEGQSTLAGGGPPVPVARELNCCTQEELEGLAGTIKVEQPTFCAYQMILSTHDMAVESLDGVH